MCMKYLNAITTPYSSALSTDEGVIISLHAPLSTIRCNKVLADRALLDDFVIITDLNFLGTDKEDSKAKNPVEQGQTFKIIIRLTKCDKDPDERKYVDLDIFHIDLAAMKKEGKTFHACFEYYNYTRLTRPDDSIRWIPLGSDKKPLVGNYVLKVIVEDAKGNQSVQSMSPIQIVDTDADLGKTVGSVLGLGNTTADS